MEEIWHTGPLLNMDGTHCLELASKFVYREYRSYTYEELHQNLKLFTIPVRDNVIKFPRDHDHLCFWREHAARTGSQFAKEYKKLQDHHQSMFPPDYDEEGMIYDKE